MRPGRIHRSCTSRGGLLAALALAAAVAGAPAEKAWAAEPEAKPWTLEALQAAAMAAEPRALAAAADLAAQRGRAAQARGSRSPRVNWWVGALGPVGALRNDPDRPDDAQPGLPLRDDPGLLSFTGHAGA